MKNVNVASLKTTIDNLFVYWMTFTYPLHKLSQSEINLMVILLRRHYILSKEIASEKYINKILFSGETKAEIADELNIKVPRLHNIYSQLKKKSIVLDERINPKFIPHLEPDATSFKIIFNFDIDG